tara:strand:+ start:912 stop:1235 length:324 start_codon:yes stop_codon:yes gene_type:complete
LGTSLTDLTSISTRGWFVDPDDVDGLLEPVSTFGWSYQLTTDPTIDEIFFSLTFNSGVTMGDLLLNTQADFTGLINTSADFQVLVNPTATFDGDFTTNINLQVTTQG